MDSRAARPRPASCLVIVTAVLVVTGCSKVPPPDRLFADEKAEQRRSICAAWQYGQPRQILTDAARGGSDRKVLAAMLLPEWTGDDPDELKEPYATLHESALRLQRGEPGDAVLRDAEPAMAATDRFFTTQCTAVAAENGGTASTGSPPR